MIDYTLRIKICTSLALEVLYTVRHTKERRKNSLKHLMKNVEAKFTRGLHV
jgi:hypothetical protein